MYAYSNPLALEVALFEDMGAVKFIRNLSKSEINEHMVYFHLIVQIRNLVEALKIVEHAIEEWDDCLAQQLSKPHGFSSRFANYRLAALLAMLYMLDEHVTHVSRRLVRRGASAKAGFEFWEKYREDAEGFLSLAKNMRASSSHVRLPIHSYRVTRSVVGTKISLRLHADTNNEDETEELHHFREKLSVFMKDVCKGELIPKFKEILTPAYDFHKSLIPPGPGRHLENLCVYEIDSSRHERGSGRSNLHAFLGKYYSDLNIGFDM